MKANTAVLVSVGAVGVAGAGWGLWRMSERKTLAGMLEADPTITTLRAGYRILGAPAGQEWVRDGEFEAKAEALLPWFDTNTAAKVFPKVLASLKPLKESPQVQKGLEQVREALPRARRQRARRRPRAPSGPRTRPGSTRAGVRPCA